MEPGRSSDANFRFDARLRDIAAHETSTELLRQLRDMTARYSFTLSLLPGHGQVSLPHYQALAEAVASGDPVAAQEAAYRHLDTALDGLRELPSREPGDRGR